MYNPYQRKCIGQQCQNNSCNMIRERKVAKHLTEAVWSVRKIYHFNSDCSIRKFLSCSLLRWASKTFFTKFFDVPPHNIKARTSACPSRSDQHVRNVMKNIRPRKKLQALLIQRNANSPFCWASELHQKGGEKLVLYSSLISIPCLGQLFNNV